jgi:hypothetical protein
LIGNGAEQAAGGGIRTHKTARHRVAVVEAARLSSGSADTALARGFDPRAQPSA